MIPKNTILVVNNCTQGVLRNGSPIACENAYSAIKNINEAIKHFSHVVLINDSHRVDDKQFNYLPDHMLTGGQDQLSALETTLSARPVIRLLKTTLNSFAHPVLSLVQSDLYVVVGFTCSLDILPSCLGLIDRGKNVCTIEDCIGDINQELKSLSLQYLTFLGVKIHKTLQDLLPS